MKKKTSYKIFTRTTGIYSITSKTSGRKYIGQSKDVASRWKNHLYQLQRGTHHCKSLQEAFSSSSVENFDFTVLLVCKKKDLLLNEIKIWEEQENCFNGKPRKGGFSDATPETKLRMSQAAKGIPKSEEHRRNISKGRKGILLSAKTKLRMSKPKSEEHRKNISKSKKGIPNSAEHTKNISKAMQNMSAEHKRNISKAMLGNTNRTGHKHTPETKLKLSQALKGKGTKPLLQYHKTFGFIVEWASAADASKATGINSGCISKCCRGERKTAGGYVWKFKQKK